jgi:AraC-like DNA-binding protein
MNGSFRARDWRRRRQGESMNAVASLVCVAGCALGMFLVAILLIQEHRSQANALLAGAIGVAASSELFSAAEHLSLAPPGGAILQLTGFPGLLFAPLLFLYFRAQRGAGGLRIADSWHFLCFVVFQSLGLSGFADLEPYLQLAGVLVVATYALATLRIVCSSPLPRLGAVFHGRRVVVVALMAALGSYLLGGTADAVADTALTCAWAVLAYNAIRRAMNRVDDEAEEAVLCPDEKPEPERTKYGNNRLPDFARESIVLELQRHMQAAQPWLKIDLTLGELAAGINVAPHHLSQIINSEFGKSFACYINEYRVGEACQLLAGHNDKSVLDVALDSGFSSKSSFNASFKKHTGMTPSEYRKTSQPKNYLVA